MKNCDNLACGIHIGKTDQADQRDRVGGGVRTNQPNPPWLRACNNSMRVLILIWDGIVLLIYGILCLTIMLSIIIISVY